MTICRFLGNACIELISKKDHIIVDPVFLVSPKKGIEKVFITHEHTDHVDPQKLNVLLEKYSKKEEVEIYAPQLVIDHFNIDASPIKPKSRINLNEGSVEVLNNNCWKSKECVAYLIEIENKKILHTADSAKFSDQLREIKNEIDYCFVACFESNFNDYLDFIKKISPKVTIPYHFTSGKEESAKKLVDFLKDKKIFSKFLEIGQEID